MAQLRSRTTRGLTLSRSLVLTGVLLLALVAPAARSRAASQPAAGGDRVAGTQAGTASDGVWQDLPLFPTGRDGTSAIYDPVRDQIVVFGGYDGTYYRNDVWVFTFGGTPAWSRLSPVGTPPAGRYGHTAVYDAARDRMIVFGGYNGTRRNDVWALTFSPSPAWTPLSPSGTPPSARYLHTAVLDSARDRMVVFGGTDGTRRNDVWSLALSGSTAWTALAPSGTAPSPRTEATAVCDVPRNRMLVFGGTDSTGDRNDVRALALSGSPTWSALSPTGTPPAARSGHCAIYDAPRQRMLVIGGYAGKAVNDSWALALAATPAWTRLSPTGTLPSPRFGLVAARDTGRDRTVIACGFDGIYQNDVWALTNAATPAWSRLDNPALYPAGREGASGVADSTGGRMLVFGGSDGVNTLGQLWRLDPSATPPWTPLAPTGTPPAARMNHVGVFDGSRNRMVVFGGFDGVGYHNDAFALSLRAGPAWSALTTTGTPPVARTGACGVMDPVRDRLLVIGGFDGVWNYNDVWSLAFGDSLRWTLLSVAGTAPQGRSQAPAVYDPVRDRVVIFGGWTGGSCLFDVWALNLSPSPSWSPITPTGTPPGGLCMATAVYDPSLDRVLVFGGTDGVLRHSETWALYLSGTPTWALLDPAGLPLSARFDHTAIFDPTLRRMVVFGGTDGSMELDDASYLWDPNVLDVPRGTGAGALALGPFTPNPARGDAWARFALSRDARVSIRVVDVAGRVVATLADGPLAAGSHVVRWDGRDAGGNAAAAGVYFVELRADGARVARRLVRVR